MISNGLIIGGGDIVADAHAGLYSEEAGNMWRNLVVGNFSAVSAAAMAIRTGVFRSLGGFDADAFPQGLFDADLCLRLREQGFRIVSTPYAEFVTTEKLSRQITDDERREFEKRWHTYIEHDPFFNENLSGAGGNFR